jgi:myo-inositol 2-dehydrogenase/D-chiro-inositol 1-dehydrogenase
MRIGMIGTGHVAPQHLDAIALVPGAEIVAVAGRDRAKADILAKTRGAAAYGDWEAMLVQERLDAVYICVIPGAAAQIAAACAGRVRGVMVEKPVGVDVAAAERAARAFAAAGTIAGAAYHNRVRAVVGRVAALCAAQPPVIADAWWHGGMPGAPWWRTRSESGGQMHEQATHLIDLLRLWMGEAVEVSAIAAHGFLPGVPDSTIDDAMTATIRFASGSIASVHASCIARPGQEFDGIGMAIRACGWQARLSGWGLDATIAHAGGKTEAFAPEPNPFLLQAQAFLRAVAADDSSALPCRFDDGVAAMRLSLAMHQSSVSGRPQPLLPGRSAHASVHAEERLQ